MMNYEVKVGKAKPFSIFKKKVTETSPYPYPIIGVNK